MGDDESARKLQKPQVSIGQVHQLVSDLFGIQVKVTDGKPEVKELDSYDDRNFLVTSTSLEGGDQKYVLKIHNGVETANLGVVKAQIRVINTLCKEGIRCPKGIPVKKQASLTTGEDTEQSGSETNALDEIAMHTSSGSSSENQFQHAVRLLHYVDGDLLSSVDVNDEILQSAGKFLALINNKLSDVKEDVLDRTLIWDSQHFSMVKKFLPSIQSEQDRSMVEQVLSLYDSNVVPQAGFLRKSVIQGDANDHNIICISDSGDLLERFGIIDFGDCTYTWLVNEVAIAMAYLTIGAVGKEKDIVSRAIAFLAGYQSILPLNDLELKLLRTLVLARSATSVTLGAYSLSKDPANEYLKVHAQPAWDALEYVLNHETEEAFTNRLRDAGITQSTKKLKTMNSE